ncbi:hypothetical protein [Microbacterium oxydans]|uniref:Uncharacterized protein n=1 Tax=Microbacterium oxydans TaxID=82380 RepID=A0A0F0LDF9_9MICO|nr:hypothetical protein [Microbacterium oxydans]KJL30310.1 hypothetical protein RS83_01060 [Microbacterium oxydans]
MSGLDLAEDANVAFADIICSDPEWVQTVFEQIVAEAMPAAMTDTMPGAREAGRQFVHRMLHAQDSRGVAQKRLERVRSPPQRPGRIRPSSTIIITSTTARIAVDP